MRYDAGPICVADFRYLRRRFQVLALAISGTCVGDARYIFFSYFFRYSVKDELTLSLFHYTIFLMANYLKNILSYVSSLLISSGQSHTESKNSRREKKVSATETKTKSLLECITKLSPRVAPKTRQNYLTAYNSFRRYVGKEEVYLSDITQDKIDEYQRWLMDKGITMNTISCYMRSLRSVYNKFATNRTKRTSNPFSGAYTGNIDTCKRSISAEDIGKIASLNIDDDDDLLWARDMFVFSFCTMGMPFCDIVSLKKSNIKDDRIVYARKKTKQTIIVKIEKPVREIIDKYYDENSVWLFPSLLGDNDMWTLGHYQRLLCRYNYLLKTIATMAGVNKKITSYVSRHSWASIANELNIGMPIVSQALGHTNSKTTQIYISKINYKHVEEANWEVLKEVIFPPLNKRRT